MHVHVCTLQVGFDANGVISGIKINVFDNAGCSNNDQTLEGYFYQFIDNG